MQSSNRKKVRATEPYAARLARQVTAGAGKRHDRIESGETSRRISVRIHGRYHYDPLRSTPEDFRRFMWAALPLLRNEAIAKGFTESQAQRMLVEAFEIVQDSSDKLWFKLKAQTTEDAERSRTESVGGITPVAGPPVQELHPLPEFAWSETSYRARKAVEEFSEDTHANYSARP